MNDFVVPTVQVEVEALLSGGQLISGCVFLPSGTPHHAGPELPFEWLNEPTGFVAFRPTGGGTAFLLNKQAVVCLSVFAADDSTLAEELASAHGVTVEAGGHSWSGILKVEGPPEKSRVLDLLNRPERFLKLVDGERHHLVRKGAITRVVESR
jgi:hypothetical protein